MISWKPSHELASTLFSLGNIFLIFSLTIGLFATLLIIWMGSVKEQYSNQEVARANESAELAKLDAANANEKAASLEKEAAEARLETEKIKQRVAWRSLTSENARKLFDILKTEPHEIIIASVRGDGEAAHFAVQLTQIFNQAKWQVRNESREYLGTLYGTIITEPETIATKRIKQAFTEAEIQFNAEILPEPITKTGSIAKTSSAIVIGIRPQVF